MAKLPGKSVRISSPKPLSPLRPTSPWKTDKWYITAVLCAAAVLVYSLLAWLLGEVPVVLHRLLGLGCAAVAVAVFLWLTRRAVSPEDLMLRVRRGQHSDFGKRLRRQREKRRVVKLPIAGEVSVRVLGGVCIFAVVAGWWLTPLAPVRIKEHKIEDLSLPLGDEIMAAVLVMPGRRIATLQPPLLPPRARELAGQIDNDADSYKLGMKAIAEGRFPKARKLLTSAVEKNPAGTADIFAALGQNEMYAAQFGDAADRFAGASGWFDKALQEKPDDPRILAQAAAAWMHAGNFHKAEPLIDRAVKLCPDSPDRNDPLAAACLHLQAVAHVGLGKSFVEAARISSRACDLFTEVFGREHPAVAAALSNQATLYALQGNCRGAENLYGGARDIWFKSLGPKHPLAAAGLANLAMLQIELGRYEEAEEMGRQAAAIRGEALADVQTFQVFSQSTSAAVSLALARYDEAQQLAEDAESTCRKVFGGERAGMGEHANMVAVEATLAAVYREKALYARAESHYLLAEAIVKKVFGPKHPYLAAVLNGLAQVYLAQGCAGNEAAYTRAEQTAERALKLARDNFGEIHPGAADALNLLGELEIVRGQTHNARPLLDEALKIRQQAFGPEHPDVARTLGNLAALDDSSRTYLQGVSGYKKAIVMAEKLLGGEHPEVARLRFGLARLHAGQGKFERAAPQLEQALEIREQTLVPYHPDLAATLEAYATLLEGSDADRAAALRSRAGEIRRKHAETDLAE